MADTPTPGQHPSAPAAAKNDKDKAAKDAENYPKTVYHKDSKPGRLIAKTVQNAEEEKALGGEWGDVKSLGFATAPAEGENDEDDDKPKKK
jgi:hypothetical protein